VQKTHHRDPKNKFKGEMMDFEMLERRKGRTRKVLLRY
jgi:hypothetical protein